MIVALVRAMRPKQWLKNSFVLAPLLFGKQFLKTDQVLRTLEAFGLFCALASAVYLVNDIVDREKDAAHPVKKARPIASGELSVSVAMMAAGALAGGALAVAFLRLPWLGVVLAIYGVVNVAYSFGLKNVVILDIFAIAIGFVLRVLGGAAAIHVEASRWLLTCTIFLSLFLAACKRRSEIARLGDDGATRDVLRAYSIGFVDQIIMVAMAGTILTYALYTLDPVTIAKLGTRDLVFTLPFVMYGMFRYLHVVRDSAEGESPTELLLKDRWVQLAVIGYVATIVFLLLAFQGTQPLPMG